MTAAPWTRARAMTAAIGVVIAAGLLFYSVRGLDWREAGRIIRGASPPLLRFPARSEGCASGVRAAAERPK